MKAPVHADNNRQRPKQTVTFQEAEATFQIAIYPKIERRGRIISDGPNDAAEYKIRAEYRREGSSEAKTRSSFPSASALLIPITFWPSIFGNILWLRAGTSSTGPLSRDLAVFMPKNYTLGSANIALAVSHIRCSSADALSKDFNIVEDMVETPFCSCIMHNAPHQLGI
ncbi:hypothetical protein J6590_015624 [Homalodisca vitripennis]|nr:hypothetical protein J6590_015624 [Homalodisca vitripennis]